MKTIITTCDDRHDTVTIARKKRALLAVAAVVTAPGRRCCFSRLQTRASPCRSIAALSGLFCPFLEFTWRFAYHAVISWQSLLLSWALTFCCFSLILRKRKFGCTNGLSNMHLISSFWRGKISLERIFAVRCFESIPLQALQLSFWFSAHMVWMGKGTQKRLIMEVRLKKGSRNWFSIGVYRIGKIYTPHDETRPRPSVSLGQHQILQTGHPLLDGM